MAKASFMLQKTPIRSEGKFASKFERTENELSDYIATNEMSRNALVQMLHRNFVKTQKMIAEMQDEFHNDLEELKTVPCLEFVKEDAVKIKSICEEVDEKCENIAGKYLNSENVLTSLTPRQEKTWLDQLWESSFKNYNA